MEQAFPLRFVDAEAKSTGEYPAAILLPNDAALPAALDPGTRGYIAVGNGTAHTHSSAVKFSDDPLLSSCLRGRTLCDARANRIPVLTVTRSDRVMARSGADPIWIRRDTAGRPVDFVSAGPGELHESEVLHDLLSPGRFITLLPLIHFLREVTSQQSWTPPPRRACFIVDDANLHAFHYGYLDYRKAIAHAGTHNYHMAIATIPIDHRRVNRNLAQLIRAHPARMSLLIHGNSHLHHELEGPHSEAECLRVLAQALRRVADLEKRTGLTLDRVMVPPHQRCSEAMRQAMSVLGFEAVSMDPRHLPSPKRAPLRGWNPAELSAGSIPVLPRYPLRQCAEAVPLIAFLDQPIILYGHHTDTARGLATFETTAAEINRLANVRWMGIEDINRSNYLTRREARTLFVKPYSRRVRVDIPEAISEVVVELPSQTSTVGEGILVGSARARIVDHGGVVTTDPILSSGSETLEIRWTGPSPVLSYERVPPPKGSPWPILRRFLTETRDRIQPFLGRRAF